MKRWILKSFGLRLALMGLVVLSPALRAQQSGGVPKELEPREAIGGILMAGLVGGILGLSTLSFYDKPQDNIRNISIGAGIGMIAAALYMTYNVSQVAPTGMTLQASPVESPRWALLPDWNPQTTEMSARYVVRF
jgi:hypothetical protein